MEKIPLSEIADLVQRYVQIGVVEALSIYEPVNDCVRKSDLQRWLKMAYVDPDLFNKLEKAGMIKAHKTSRSKNAPIFYSKREVKRAIAAHKVLSFVDEYKEHFFS